MEEILPGVHHWTAVHPKINIEVSSYYVERAGALIDPLVPDDGLGWFEQLDPAPQQILLTNRHHLRDSERFAEAFGCQIRASAPGLHEFEDGPEVAAFNFGEDVAPGIRTIEIGGICPDDSALHLDVDGGAIAFADALIRHAGVLSFVPDDYMDDPPRDKAAIKDSQRGVLERDFDHLLFAHGDPVIDGGKQALGEFVARHR